MRTVADVLAAIDPVDPDNLQLFWGNVYVAKWSPANPHAMDLESLKRTPGVIVLGEPTAPPHLPDWTEVYFLFAPDAPAPSEGEKA